MRRYTSGVLASRPSPELEPAIFLTVLYGEVFDHTLAVEEVASHVPLLRVEAQTVRAAVARLAEEGRLALDGELVAWPSRGDLFEKRRSRRARNRGLWVDARAFADRLRRIPYVRFVGVCGSLAVDNAPPGGDIDFVLGTEPGRLWSAQVRVMRERRRAARTGIDACPNVLLSPPRLEIGPRTMYVARELVQVVPVWGGDAWREVLAANAWALDLLPNARPERRLEGCPAAPGRRDTELRKRPAGDVVDRLLHRALVAYYCVRLRSRGIRPSQVLRAYRPDRQEVVGGGYADAVRTRYLGLVSERLGAPAVDVVEKVLFPPDGLAPEPVGLYRELLSASYGGAT